MYYMCVAARWCSAQLAAVQVGKHTNRQYERSTRYALLTAWQDKVDNIRCGLGVLHGLQYPRQEDRFVDIRAYRVKSFFPRNGRAAPTRPVSS